MSEEPSTPGIPCDPDLTAESAHEERSERWLFARQTAIILMLLALFVAQACPQGIGDGDEQRISGKVALSVIDLLEPIDVDEGHHHLLRGTTRAIDLPLKLLYPGASPPNVGKLISLRRFTVQCRLGTFVCRQGTVAGGLGTFFGRSGAINGGSVAIGGGPGAIGGRLLMIAFSAESQPPCSL